MGTRKHRLGGWIEPHGTGYRARWREPGKPTKHFSPTFDTTDEAQQYLDVLRGDYARGVYFDPAKPKTPFEVYATKWMEARPKGTESMRTRSKERTHLNVHLIPYWGKWEIGAIEPDDVQQWVNDLAGYDSDDFNDDDAGAPLKSSYISSIYGTMRLIMKAAARARYLPMGLPLGEGYVKMPDPDMDVRRFLTHRELDHLMAVALNRFPHLYPLTYVAAHTGARIGELVALQRHHFDRVNRTLLIEQSLKMNGKVGYTKNRKKRVVDVDDDELVEVIEAQLAGHDSDIVFCGPDGGFQQPYRVNQTGWRSLRSKAGFPSLRFHDLRHTHISHLLASGIDVHEVADRVGHGSTKMTLDRYGHFVPGRKKATMKRLRESREQFA